MAESPMETRSLQRVDEPLPPYKLGIRQEEVQQSQKQRELGGVQNPSAGGVSAGNSIESHISAEAAAQAIGARRGSLLFKKRELR